MKKILTALILVLYFTTLGVYASPDVGQDDRFSVEDDGRGVQLASFIRGMAKKSGYDCVIDKKLDSVTLVTFTDKTLPEAMDLLAKAHNFNWTIEGNTLVASRTDTTSISKSFNLQYANPELAKKDLMTFIPDKQITVNPEAASITVEGTYLQVQKAANRLKELDVPVKQVMIQALFIELRPSESMKLGFSHSWGNYDSTKDKPLNIQYAVTMEAEKIISTGKMLASPSIMTLNGMEANINAGDKVPVLMTTVATDGTKSTTVEYKDVGYKLKVTPHVTDIKDSDQQFVTLSLEPEVSSITGYVENSNTKAPQMSSRTAKTIVRVLSGGTVLIGGLIKDEDLKSMVGIPGLSQIPILGELFKMRTTSHDKAEIFILVKPIIVDETKDKSPATSPNIPVLPSMQDALKGAI